MFTLKVGILVTYFRTYLCSLVLYSHIVWKMRFFHYLNSTYTYEPVLVKPIASSDEAEIQTTRLRWGNTRYYVAPHNL